jgi:hypothetical protein
MSSQGSDLLSVAAIEASLTLEPFAGDIFESFRCVNADLAGPFVP